MQWLKSLFGFDERSSATEKSLISSRVTDSDEEKDVEDMAKKLIVSERVTFQLKSKIGKIVRFMHGKRVEFRKGLYYEATVEDFGQINYAQQFDIVKVPDMVERQHVSPGDSPETPIDPESV